MKTLLPLALILLLFTIGCNKTRDTKSLPKISPYLFGQNINFPDITNSVILKKQPLIWQSVSDNNIKLIRIGGNELDEFFPSIDTLEKWIKAIKAIGAEPLLQVSRYKSPNESANLVKYFNSTPELKVMYWSISNEPIKTDSFAIASISGYIKSHSSAMKSIDPSIKVLAPDFDQYNRNMFNDLLFNDKYSIAGRDEYGNWYIDGISIHFYPNIENYTRSDIVFKSIDMLRGVIMSLKSKINKANIKYNRKGNDELLWALTEFNICSNKNDFDGVEGISSSSFINGQFWAEVYGLCMEFGAFTVNPEYSPSNSKHNPFPGYIEFNSKIKKYSSYYHQNLIAQNMLGHYLKLKTSSPFVKAYGAISENKTTILLMNQETTKAFKYDLNDINNEAQNNDLNIFSETELKTKKSGTLEPNTTLLLSFNNKGDIKKQIVYNMEMASKYLPHETIKQ